MENWDDVLVKENVFCGALYGGNSNCKDNGPGWLLLSFLEALGKENKKQRE